MAFAHTSSIHILVSSSPRPSRVDRLGTAPDPDRLVANKFSALFAKAGLKTAFVEAPEAIKTQHALRAIGVAPDERPVHISFRAPPDFRPIPVMPNVLAAAWQFPVMKAHQFPGEIVTANWAHMLRLADALWVPCSFTRDVYARYGLKNTAIVPYPVALAGPRPTRDAALQILRDIPAFPFKFSSGISRDANASALAPFVTTLGAHFAAMRRHEAGPCVLALSVLDPCDLCKNLANLVEGFQLAARNFPHARLLLKLMVPNQGDFRHTALYDYLLPRFLPHYVADDPRIICIADSLSENEMQALNAVADLYVSASHCEAFNLALAEAIGAGSVPVSTYNTGMVDYLAADGMVRIRERNFLNPILDAPADSAGEPYTLSVADRFDVARAFQRAFALGAEERHAISVKARNAASVFFSPERVSEIVLKELHTVLDETARRL